MSQWNFFTNYGHIIFLLSKNSKITVREIAEEVGITQRMVLKIIHDLVEDGFVKVKKEGRNNSYKIVGRKKLRHRIEKNCRIDELIEVISSKNKDS